MASLLSPGKPVRSRFKVPGEGSYELAAEMHAPTLRIPSSSSSTTAATGPAKSGQAATSSSTNSSASVGGPLGLANVTSISFLSEVGLSCSRPSRTSGNVSSQDPNLISPALQSPSQSGVPSSNHQSTSTSLLASAASAPQSTGSSIFSLRKLTGLGSSISSKFGTSSDGHEDSQPSRSWQQPSVASIPPNIGGPALRAPPRVASSSVKQIDDSSTALSHSQQASSSSQFSNSFPNSSFSQSPERESNNALSQDTADVPAHHGVVVYNAGDSVLGLDLACCAPLTSSPNTLDATLTLNIRSVPTAHALQSSDGLRLLVGCVNGEVYYYPDISHSAASAAPESGKRARMTNSSASSNGGSPPTSLPCFVYNRDGATNSTRIVSVRWVPNSGFRFIAAHVDGAIVVYDTRLKPHSSATRTGPLSSSTQETSEGQPAGNGNGSSGSTAGSLSLRPGGRDVFDKGGTSEKPDPNRDRDKDKSNISTGATDKGPSGPGHRRTASSAAAIAGLGQHEVSIVRGHRGKRNNPVAVWQLGCGIITDCCFSPLKNGKSDSALLAVTGRDGYLRIMDFSKETPIVAFRSYFGALLCVAWSPDGKYVAAGGEDDLVSIWCPSEERIVARLEGHTSWVSSVAWDNCLGGSGRYRIGSAGQDAKLLLWDFALEMLHHRTAQQRLGTNMVRLRSYARDSTVNSTSINSNGSAQPGGVPSERRAGKLARLRGHGSAHTSTHGAQAGGDGDNSGTAPAAAATVIGALGRAEVPIVEPVISHVAHAEPLTNVVFLDGGVLTADTAGNVKFWSRPPQQSVPPLSLGGKSLRRRGNGTKLEHQKTADLD